MAARRTTRSKKDVPLTPWGTLDWSHAPVARDGDMGPCVHCRKPAIMKHPATGKPCHKVCDDMEYDTPEIL